MSSLPRFSACTVLALGLLVGVGYGSARLTSGSSGLGTSLKTLGTEACRRCELTRKSDALQQVLKAKSRITPQVVAGRMTLIEAVAAFRAAYEDNPECLPTHSLHEERLAANVLNWVRSELQTRGDTKEAVLRRLEAEFQGLKSRESIPKEGALNPPSRRRASPPGV